MTIIKQRGVTTKGHQENLRKYINGERKVLLRDGLNMEECRDLRRWASHMAATRKAFGHDKASRRVRDPKTGKMVAAKNTLMYHQILAFLPDECDVNGGRLTPQDCMAYAKEYASAYYPDQEIVMALHDEWCKEDRTHRYAVHIVINRTNLSTGRRLDEGRGNTAKVRRAERVRAMDKEWGLRQVEEGTANSEVHRRQPSKAEREMRARGAFSYKANLRELCRIAAERARSLHEYREMLEGWGVSTEFRNGRMYATDTDNARHSFSVAKLDAALDRSALDRAFATNGGGGTRAPEGRRGGGGADTRLSRLKEAYLSDIRQAYIGYRERARELEGTRYADFPKLRLRRPPEEIEGDQEVRRAILAYWRGADELRARLASEVPYRRQPKAGGASRDQGGQGRYRGQGRDAAARDPRRQGER